MTNFAKVIVWWHLRHQTKNSCINIRCRYFWIEVADYTHAIEIRRLFVSHRYKRRGFGSAIITYLKRMSAQTNKPLRATIVLDDAMPFYEKHGFEQKLFEMIFLPSRII